MGRNSYSFCQDARRIPQGVGVGGGTVTFLYLRSDWLKNTVGNHTCETKPIANIVSYTQGSATIGFIPGINTPVIYLSHKVCELNTWAKTALSEFITIILPTPPNQEVSNWAIWVKG